MVHPAVVVPKRRGLASLGVEKGYELTGGLLQPSRNARFSAVGFQGAGIIGGELLESLTDLQVSLSKLVDRDALRFVIAAASGAFTAQVMDHVTRDLIFVNDPLGGGLLFQYDDDVVTAVSSDVTSLRGALERYGVSVERDLLFELSRVATGTASYAADSPFHGVDAVPPGQGVEIDANGTVSSFPYVAEGLPDDALTAYNDVIEQAAADLQSSLTVIINSGREVVADITGGFDSRLVLAGLHSIGAQSSVDLTSLEKNVEWPFAQGLAAETGFRLTGERFRGGAPKAPASAVESALAGARSSSGILDNGMDPLSLPFSIVTLQGGYGETFRTFSSFNLRSLQDFSELDFASELWAWTRLERLEVNGVKLFRTSLKEDLAMRLDRFIRPVVAAGISSDYISSYLYLVARNRYWVGQQSYWRSHLQTRLDPLYSPRLIALAERLPFENRKANFIGLDLMKRLSPGLLTLPFHNVNVVSSRWIRERGPVASREFSGRSPEQRPTKKMASSSLVRRGPSDVIEPEDSRIAAALGVSALRVAGIRKWGAQAFQAILYTDQTSGYFNERPLRSLLLDRPESSVGVATASMLIAALMRSGVLDVEFASDADRYMFG